MPTSRPVTLVHCPLTSLSGTPNPLAHQVANHMAVEVGHPGNITRFELEVNPDRKTVKLRMTKNVERELYKPAQVLVFESDIKGETSLSDGEIEKIAQGLIEKHGNYRLLLNNCQVWASYLFNEITDVKGHLGMRVSATIAKPMLALYRAIF